MVGKHGIQYYLQTHSRRNIISPKTMSPTNLHLRILCDTNILIYREQPDTLDPNLAELFALCTQNNVTLYHHPLTIDEIQRCPDIEKRKIQQSKVQAYPKLEPTPCPYASKDQNFLEKVNPTGKEENSHDKNDNRLLYAVYKNTVHLLVTNDQRLFKKAKRVGCETSVFLIDGAVTYLKQAFAPSHPAPIPFGIKRKYLSELDLEDPIFESLKDDYPDFSEWFQNKSREGKQCYISEMRGEPQKLGSILITKDETESISAEPPLPEKRRLKISTLKVANLGMKLGECLINIAIREALENKIDELYLTHFPEPEEDSLCELIAEYGFEDIGIYHNKYSSSSSKEEHIYLKKLYPSPLSSETLNEPILLNQKYYPSYYDGPQVRKYIIPIQEEFYNRLFSSVARSQTTLEMYADMGADTTTNIPGVYAVKKAYITRSKIKKLKEGDILICYKTYLGQKTSGKKSCITEICIIDKVYTQMTDVEEISKITRSRTVYGYQELERIKKPLTIILFKHNVSVTKTLTAKNLTDNEILNGPPQSITEITHEKYQKLIDIGAIDGRFTIN